MAKKQSYLKRKQTFSGAQVLLFILVFAAVGAVAIWQSLAAPHKSSGGGTISLNLPPVIDNNSDGLPNWGDTVNFNISTTATAQPYVNLVCSGTNVGYNSWKGVFPGSLDTNWNFVLSSGGWTSGPADCTATLGMYTKHGFTKLASTSFHVNA